MRPADNPFRVSRIEALPYRFPPGDSWEDFLARLDARGYRGDIIGPKGAGKTTLCMELTARLSLLGLPARYLRLQPGQPLPDLASDCRAAVWVVDGSETLAPLRKWRWQAASRQVRGLILTRHGPGRKPPLAHCQPSPEVFLELTRNLWPGHGLDPVLLRGLFARQAGNVRECFRQLYDWQAGLVTPETWNLEPAS